MDIPTFRDLKRRVLSLCMEPPSPSLRPGFGGRRRGSVSPLAIGRPIALGARLTPSPGDVRPSVLFQDRSLAENETFLAALRAEVGPELITRYIGEIQLSARKPDWLRHRTPFPRVGFSVSGPANIAGTIGFFADDKQGQRVLVSNRHVLSPGTSGVGAAIWQPGWADGGQGAGQQIGNVTVAAPVVCASHVVRPDEFNYVDAACAALHPDVKGSNFKIPYLRCLRGVTRPAYELMPVCKVGRTTGFTHGCMTEMSHGPFWIHWGNGRYAWFDEQLVIAGVDGGFSTKGDSGSLVVDEFGAGVGLIFADNGHPFHHPNHLSFANPLVDVLDALGLDSDSIQV